MSLERIPLRPPAQWSAAWFERWVYETLAPLVDPTAGGGETVQDLLDAGVVTALPPSGLPGARAIVGQPGVISVVDHGTSIELKLAQHSVSLAHMRQLQGPAVLGASSDMMEDVEPIPAETNGHVLCRLLDELGFAAITNAMLPAALAPTEQLVFPPYATVDRPTPTGPGAAIFDTTLGLPIWYDGTNWVDAAGNTV